MVHHKFAIGAQVLLATRAGLYPAAAETYRVTALLPEADQSPQYRLRNDEFGQERVSKEDDLSAVPFAATRPATGDAGSAKTYGKPRHFKLMR